MLERYLDVPTAQPPANARGLDVSCIGTPGDDEYIGVVRKAVIGASRSVVERVLDDVSHYKDLFPGTVDVRIVSMSPSGARFTTRWEQRVPVFFMPNEIYELSHTVDKSAASRSIYRYQLIRGNHLQASDGMVVLESSGPSTTYLTEYAFFRAKSVPVPTAMLWRESVRAAYVANAAIKLKAENADWSYERVAQEAGQLASSEDTLVERCRVSRSTDRSGTLP